jgi:subtilisin inhibitor-like
MTRGWRGAAVLVFVSAGMLAATPFASADTGSTDHSSGQGAPGPSTPVVLPNQPAGSAPAYPLPNASASGGQHAVHRAPANSSPAYPSGPTYAGPSATGPTYSGPTNSAQSYPGYAGPRTEVPANHMPANHVPANQTPGNQTPGNPAPPAAAATQLAITIASSTVPGHNGQFTLTCQPTGGTHPDPTNACAKLDQFAAAGTDPFAPVPANQMCTMIAGGPATARIVGSWQGRRIDTTFSRTNGCQTNRWNNLLPILSPETAS